MKLLVIGASGFLGKKIKNIFEKKYEVFGTCYSNKFEGLIQADILDKNSIKKVLYDTDPDVVIHAAAMTDVKMSEEKKDLAKKINGDSTLFVAKICKEIGAKMVYISSDYVFSGNNSPYNEENIPHPINYYGHTKLLGENVKSVLKDYAVVRVAILYGYNDEFDKVTFPTGIIRKLKEEKEIAVDNYRLKYPTFIDDVAAGIEKIVKEGKIGIFHFCNDEPMTRYEWALKVAEVFELNAGLIKGEKLEKDTYPKRPINVQMINNRLNFEFTKVSPALKIMKRQMEGNI